MKLSELLSLDALSPVEDGRDGWVATCPAHADSRPSLRVAVSAAGRVLLKCRAGCDTRAVLAAVGASFHDLTAMVVDVQPVGLATSQDVAPDTAAVAALAADLDRWMMDWPDAAAEYVAARFGLDDAARERLELGSTTTLGGGLRVVVPFRDPQGVPCGFQARAVDPDAQVRWLGPKSPDGASWSKLAWFSGGTDWPEVFVTEGPGDGLTAAGIGYDAVAIRGAALGGSSAVLDTLLSWCAGRPVVVAGDGDHAGREFSARLARALSDRGVEVRRLGVPDGLDLSSWRERDPSLFVGEVTAAVAAAPVESSTAAAMMQRDTIAYPLTDLGNARFTRDFIRGRGFGVRFSPEGGFFILHGGVWRPDKLDRTRAFVQEAAERTSLIARTLQENAVSQADEKTARAWASWAKYSQSSQGISAALRELQADLEVACDIEDFDTHEHLLAVRNGVVDLRTGELLPHDPGLLLTRRVDCDYNPAAQCERWEQFLQEVFPNHPDMPDYMRRLVGYGITGSTSEQCFAIHYGGGSNGKSVFTDTLVEVFEEHTTVTPFSTFEASGNGSGIPNDLAALKGARLVMASEGEQGRPMAEAMLKRVTGRDRIAARFMRREFFEFKPTFLLMLATNYKPSFRGQDDGLWRRVKLIPWERRFAAHERDGRLPDKLLAERQGILAWAVRGAVEWYRGGLADPATITDGNASFRDESDVLGDFLDEWQVDPEARTKRGEVFEAFRDWADRENHENLKRWSSRAFYAGMVERGFPQKKSGEWYLVGLRRKRPSEV